MLWETLKAARDLGRLHDIASILIRYGFSDVVRRLGLGRILEQAGKVLRWKDAEQMARMETPERVRRALEEMGPTFIKLGQILATRVDLFPPEWIGAFEKLQDQIKPKPFSALRPQLEEDLGDAPEHIFAHIETQALAAGSIAQVHRARLETGEEVILKIRHPNIRPIIEADLRLAARVAEVMEREIPETRNFHPIAVVRQVNHSLRRELDFAAEGRHAERLAVNFVSIPEVVFPKVFWAYTCERLIVQEFISGIPGRNIAAAESAGLNRKRLALRGANAVLKMVVEDGFFHADPHPGNLFYLPGDRIAFIDLGMVGRLSAVRRTQVIDLIRGLIGRETQRVIDVLMEWATDGHVQVNIEYLSSDIEFFLDNYHGVALKRINIGTMLSDLTLIMRDYQLAMPPDLALLLKVFITLEGLGRQLDPDFDMVSEAAPFIQREIAARYQPDVLARRGWSTVTEIADVVAGLPRDLRRLVRAARRGALQFNVDMPRLERFGKELDRSANRLTLGMVTSAMIIGTSIVMTVQGGPTLFGLPLFGMAGFFGAAIAGIWLLLSIRRSGRDQ